jgi:AcrR family transcriptional regulator
VTRVTIEAMRTPTVASRGASRRDVQRDATRARLFDETVHEFKRVGFLDTEIAVVAERAGVSRGAFYVHFAGKDDVLREILLSEEHRIATEVRPLVERGQPLEDVLHAIVDAALKAERRLGRRLIRDLCAAQFRPEFSEGGSLADHPVAQVLLDALGRHPVAPDVVDLATVFLTGLFGLLATGDGPQAERRHHLDLLVRIVSEGATSR